MDAQPPPGETLLADVDRHGPMAVVVGAGPAAQLGQHVVGGDRVPMVLDHPLSAPDTARLLVADTEVDQIPFGSETFGGEPTERDRHRRRQVEHVDRPATPHLAVDQLATERILTPAVGIDRYDVGVAHQTQRRCVGVGPLDACDHRVAAGAWGEAFDLQACPLQVGHEQVGVAGLVAGVRRAVVDAGIADQGLQQLGRGPGELVG